MRTARILCICELVADARAAAGNTTEAIRILQGAATEYPDAAGDAAGRLATRARDLGALDIRQTEGNIVRSLAEACAPELEVRKVMRSRSGA